MGLKQIKVDGQPILVEETDLSSEAGRGGEGAGGFKHTKAPTNRGKCLGALVVAS